MKPSLNGPNGRDSSGRFAKGNSGGPGNPLGHRVAALRRALLEAVSEKDLRAIIAKLVEQAKAGDIQAAKEVLMRTLGKPVETDLIERLEHLEELLARRARGEEDEA
jgi:hypothetical protein